MLFCMHPIGVLHTPFHEKTGMPIQSARSDTPGTLDLLPEWEAGLQGIDAFSHIFLIYAFHQAPADVSLSVTPFLDDQAHGLFATRYPVRPNPIGLSVVRLMRREGCRLHFVGADMLDGTPLLDIKPYIPEFDIHQVDHIGWYQNRALP